MTNGKAIEYRITQHLMQRGSDNLLRAEVSAAERLIYLVAASAGLLLLGSLSAELLWVALGGAAVVAMGVR